MARKKNKRLKKFLKANGLLTRFKLNMKNSNKGYGIPTFKDRKLTIAIGFIWEQTPEGFKFWGRKYEQYEQYESCKD